MLNVEAKIPDGQNRTRVEEAFEVQAGDFGSGLIFLCDHASNRLPEKYGSLGLPPEQLERHIGYDIGAASVTRKMAQQFNAPAVLSRFCRLLIDPNRGTDDPTLIMRLSDGAVVPGNAQITTEDVQHRIDTYYEPYHAAIDAIVDEALACGHVPALVSIHSYTDIYGSTSRHWHCGILWDKDLRLAVPLIERLRADEDIIVGDNEPYTGQLFGDCMYKHGTAKGLPHVLIEIRQDLIRSEEGQKEWADRLSRHMAEILEDPAVMQELSEIKHFGSHSDK